MYAAIFSIIALEKNKTLYIQTDTQVADRYQTLAHQGGFTMYVCICITWIRDRTHYSGLPSGSEKHCRLFCCMPLETHTANQGIKFETHKYQIPFADIYTVVPKVFIWWKILVICPILHVWWFFIFMLSLCNIIRPLYAVCTWKISTDAECCWALKLHRI
jgi:hypothetical protein